METTGKSKPRKLSTSASEGAQKLRLAVGMYSGDSQRV